ncbi:hypothetical protein CPAV1605_516 [seawater metagenome]|uniref:Uncharacterized protein n=1 Tax=seawater metagenome TaxID=1561972 RepID=A0A5E8CHS9_9ZZZZ
MVKLWSQYSINIENINYISIKTQYSDIKSKFEKLKEDKSKLESNGDNEDVNSEENTYDNNNKVILERINNFINKDKEGQLEFNKKNSLDLLQLEETISNYLCKYVLQNNYLNHSFFISTLKIIQKISSTLRDKINQKKFSHDLRKIKITNSIPRSSYKFCHFKEDCVYNYDSKKSGCYADHYVHNMIEADIEALIEYININYKDNNIINHNKEIIKCINTLCFVIKHMESELKSLCIYAEPKEYDKLHQNKVIHKKPKKNFKKKKI